MVDNALLVIDMLNDFVGKNALPAVKSERADSIIPNVKRLVDAARLYNIPVIYGNDSHLPVDREINIWGQHAMRGSRGSHVIDEIRPESKDYVIEKRTYSAFRDTGLDRLLVDLGVQEVIISGLHTNICDRHTAADAYELGYKIVVTSDATEAFTEKDHKEGLEYIKMVYGAKVKTVDEVVKEFEKVSE